MKKFILPILACLAVGVTSCESMLDIPQKGVVSYDDYYANDDDAYAALVNMYKQYINNVAATEGIDVPEQVLINYAADDILAAGADFSDHIDFRVFDEFKYDNANKVLKNAYNRYMYSIYHANLVISNFTTENRYGTAPKWESEKTKQYVAEARVMRAYLHLMLALSWNTPPILDRVYNPDEAIVSAESQSKVLEWVISECDKAITSGYLPKRNGQTDKDATARMSVGFAQFIAGKAAVFNNDMATARKYLGDLINSKDYDLVASEDFWTNFHMSGDGNAETIFEPNYIEDPNFTGMMIGRWMVANVFCWRTDALASSPTVHLGNMGWNGGAIQEDFAEKFLAHDGKSPRRLATFLTEEEFLYEMDWSGSEVNGGTLAEKKADPKRGISSANGVFGHGKFFEWKHMVFINPPAILTKGKTYPADNVTQSGPASNETNYGVARYAEALLLYAEACIGSADAAKGLQALNKVQERSGSGKISTELTIQNVMEEKQYELWFEGCRFHDVIRWGKLGYLNTNDVFNTSKIHQEVPTVYDAYFTVVEGREDLAQYKGKEHFFYTVHTSIPSGGVFELGRHEYYPFPLDVTKMNPNLKSYGAWGN